MANVRALFPLVMLFFLLGGSRAIAAPLPVEDVPEPLRPWIRWVLHDLPQARCPYLQGSTSERRCQWPSRLTLALGEKDGTFSQRWQVHERGWVPLPGDSERWPLNVEVDGASAVVIARSGVPGSSSRRASTSSRAPSSGTACSSRPGCRRRPGLELDVDGKRDAAP
ncbi:MAG: hypothetical protein R3B09_07765 [Nannocystaceae bacterium]